MPRIPDVPQVVNLRSPEVGPPQSEATGQQFGAGVGAAIAGLGATIQQVGAQVGSAFKEQQAKADTMALATADATNSFHQQYNDFVTNYADPSGKGLTKGVSDNYDRWMNGVLEGYQKQGWSQDRLNRYRIKLLQDKGNFVDSAADQQIKLSNQHAQLELNTGLATQANDVASNGATSQPDFLKAEEKSHTLIDSTQHLTVAQKEAAKQKQTNELAQARFNAMAKAAKTPEEIQALMAELNTDFWKKRFQIPDYQREQQQLAQAAQRMAELGIGTTADAHINAINANPDDYDKELEAGLKEYEKQPFTDPAVKAKGIADYRATAAAVRFESKAEALSYYTTPENQAKLVALQKELKQPKWQKELGGEYDKVQNSLDTHLKQINSGLTQQAKDLVAEHDKLVTKQNAELRATLDTMMERNAKGEIVPDSEITGPGGLIAQIGVIGKGEVTLELQNKMHQLSVQQSTYRIAKNQPVNVLQQLENSIVNGADKRYEPTKNGGIVQTHKNGAQIGASMANAGKLRGMTPQYQTMLDGVMGEIQSTGVTRLVMTAGKEGGHLSHLSGTEGDFIGYQANGQPWTQAQRAAVARLFAKHGANRFGLYETGRYGTTLHIGYAHQYGQKYFPAAVWGAAGLTGGDASRAFRDPANQQFLASVRGGRGGGGAAGRVPAGRVAGFYADLRHFESGNANVTNERATTSSGRARGYFQITDGTWADFGGKAAGYATAQDAPYNVQKAVADKIPMKRWATETLDYLRDRGWKLDLDKTLAENAAMNGDTADAGGGDVAGGGGGGGGGAVTSLAMTPTGMSIEQSWQLAAIQKEKEAQQAAMNADFMSFAARGPHGFPLGDLLTGNEADWKQWEQNYNAAIATHNPNDKQRQPFTQQQEAAIDNIMASGTDAQKLSLFSKIATWTKPTQEDAYRQIGEKNVFGATIGRLAASDRADMAATAMFGDNRLKALEANGAKAVWQEQADGDFTRLMGSSLSTDPFLASGRKRVYDSVYAAKYGTGNDYNAANYEKVVEDVEGGKFGTVNGARVLMPPGVTETEMALAPTAWDWTQVSYTGTPPIAQNPNTGAYEPINNWIKANAKPVRVGGGVYAFLDDNNAFLWTKLQDGRLQHYAARLDTPTIKIAAANAQQAIEEERRTRASEIPTGQSGSPTLRTFQEDITKQIENPPAPPIEPAAPMKLTKEQAAQAKRSMEAYRSALISRGMSEAEAEEAVKGFAEVLRHNYLTGQGQSR